MEHRRRFNESGSSKTDEIGKDYARKVRRRESSGGTITRSVTLELTSTFPNPGSVNPRFYPSSSSQPSSSQCRRFFHRRFYRRSSHRRFYRRSRRSRRSVCHRRFGSEWIDQSERFQNSQQRMRMLGVEEVGTLFLM